MTPRVKNPFKSIPEAYKLLGALEATFETSGLAPSLRELVKLRASQINGCAFCIQMHWADAQKQGESELRLAMLTAWRESPLYSDRERAALGWTEALTRVAETGAPDEDYAELAFHFSEAEQVQLSLLIGTINLWNRIQVGFRALHAMGDLRAAA